MTVTTPRPYPASKRCRNSLMRKPVKISCAKNCFPSSWLQLLDGGIHPSCLQASPALPINGNMGASPPGVLSKEGFEVKKSHRLVRSSRRPTEPQVRSQRQVDGARRPRSTASVHRRDTQQPPAISQAGARAVRNHKKERTCLQLLPVTAGIATLRSCRWVRLHQESASL